MTQISCLEMNSEWERDRQGSWALSVKSFSLSLLRSRSCLTLISFATHASRPRAQMDKQNCTEYAESLNPSPTSTGEHTPHQGFAFKANCQTPCWAVCKQWFTLIKKMQLCQEKSRGLAFAWFLLRYIYGRQCEPDPEWKWQHSLLHGSLWAKAHWVTLQRLTGCGILYAPSATQMWNLH